MTPETRRNVFRYGIAVDLVIVAIGAGMYLRQSLGLLFVFFGAAVLVSAWKGGWQSAATALLLSVVALATMFSVGVTPLVLFALATGITAAALHATLHWRVPLSNHLQPAAPAQREQLPLSDLGALNLDKAAPAPAPEAEEEEEQRAEAERVRKEAEERVAAERAEAERVRKEAEERLAREREEAERVRKEAEERVAAERAEAERAEAERVRKEAEERLAREREEAEREKARLEAERAEAERVRKETEERVAREREEAEREKTRLEAARREAEERVAREREEAARALQERLDLERAEAERVRKAAEERAAQEREEAERERARLEAARKDAEERAAREREEAERERARLEAAHKEAEERAAQERERLAREREEAERALQARVEAERIATEEKLRKELDQEREAMRLQLEQQLAAEREALAKATAAAADAIAPKSASPAAPKPSGPSLLDTVTSWFHREPRTKSVNLTTKRVSTNGTATKRPQAAPPARRNAPAAKTRKPRIVFLERRRGTAETIVPKLRQRGIEVSVVERWVDAADEMLRMKPDAFFLDVEHPDFDVVLKTTLDKSGNLPIVLTGRSPAAAPAVRYSAFVVRPYDVEEVTRVAQQAMTRPDELLAPQTIVRPAAAKAPPVPAAAKPSATSLAVTPPGAPVGIRREPPPPTAVVATPVVASNDEYEVSCFTCRVQYNAVEADWCSCLAKERTLVCTNCLSCFCKAPPAFKEKFWVEAPPRLFERKTAEARKQLGTLPANTPVPETVRPLVLSVEDDEDIQAIVQRVCTNLGYGFVHANNGQDGLEVARTYRPNLILSDAFMPKLDGREMCRMLKEEPAFAETPMVVMTGLYTDTKYRTEALKRFKIDDYVAKPVSVTDLINLLQKHLEGVSGLPVQDDLYELHRKELGAEGDDETDVSIADVLAHEAPDLPIIPEVIQVKRSGYHVSCFNCESSFDASHADWCRCVGRDNTLVCSHCGGCFCKAPAPYKERFWIDAPPTLFERKMIGSKRNLSARTNPPASDVKRPLILLVEDDENVQLIVRTVVTTMGYGFVVGANGQEGLSLAREYSPELILSDAFMPKLDGREMCRLLKEDPTTARSKAIIMTGLYTDRKYRNEALDYFKVDDYVAKPLAVDDLIKLFKKHLPQEVVTAH